MFGVRQNQFMYLIQEIIEKYNGEYFEYKKREILTPSGKYATQFIKGNIEIDGTKISINKVENVGVNFNIPGANKIFHEPYKIFLYLNKDVKAQLSIYPKSKLKKILDLIIPNKRMNPAISITKEYDFNGDKDLIREITSYSAFCESLKDTNLFISITKSSPPRIMLIPNNGNINLDEFDKYILILKTIENKINKTTK